MGAFVVVLILLHSKFEFMKKRQKSIIGKICLCLLFICTLSTSLLAQEKSITFYAAISEASLTDWTGHVWIGLKDGNSNQVLGFYPGGLKDDSNIQEDVSYTFNISDSDFEEAQEVVDEFRKAKYLLGIKDCRRFAQSVALAAGLNVPSVGMKSPAEWMGSLVEKN